MPRSNNSMKPSLAYDFKKKQTKSDKLWKYIKVVRVRAPTPVERLIEDPDSIKVYVEWEPENGSKKGQVTAEPILTFLDENNEEEVKQSIERTLDTVTKKEICDVLRGTNSQKHAKLSALFSNVVHNFSEVPVRRIGQLSLSSVKARSNMGNKDMLAHFKALYSPAPNKVQRIASASASQGIVQRASDSTVDDLTSISGIIGSATRRINDVLGRVPDRFKSDRAMGCVMVPSNVPDVAVVPSNASNRVSSTPTYSVDSEDDKSSEEKLSVDALMDEYGLTRKCNICEKAKNPANFSKAYKRMVGAGAFGRGSGSLNSAGVGSSNSAGAGSSNSAGAGSSNSAGAGSSNSAGAGSSGVGSSTGAYGRVDDSAVVGNSVDGSEDSAMTKREIATIKILADSAPYFVSDALEWSLPGFLDERFLYHKDVLVDFRANLAARFNALNGEDVEDFMDDDGVLSKDEFTNSKFISYKNRLAAVDRAIAAIDDLAKKHQGPV